MLSLFANSMTIAFYPGDISDTYVKLTLMSPNGQEITRSKTSIRRGQPHPLFKETFMFQVGIDFYCIVKNLCKCCQLKHTGCGGFDMVACDRRDFRTEKKNVSEELQQQ